MRGWLPALRIARREARKAKGRSSLVLAMIGLPVAALAFTAVTYDMFRLTPQERLDRRLGAADAHIMWVAHGEVRQTPDGDEWTMLARPGTGGLGESQEQQAPTEAEVLAMLPAGTQLRAVEETGMKVRTPDGIGNAQVRTADAADPLLRGIVELREGRAAKTADEIVLNAAAAEWLGTGVGGTISAVGPDRTFRVTGVVEFPDQLTPVLAVAGSSGKGTKWLADTPGPVDWEQVKRLNKSGYVVVSRAVTLGIRPPDAGAYYGAYAGGGVTEELATGVVVAGLAVLEIILLAGPAFAVGARRRSRDLALVAAAGGEPKQLRRIVLADGVVLGFAGAVAGLVLGVVAALIGRPLIEEYLAGSRAGGYRFFPLALAGIAGLAVVTGLLAALVPAFTAARQPVVMALAGRRGILRSRKRWVFLGLTLMALGAAVATFGATQFDETTMLGGVVIGELGLVLITPALIGLVARLGRWLPLSSRLALRDTARNRASAAPAISAVMAAVAGAVAAGVVFGANHEQSVAQYQPRLPHGHIDIEHYAGFGQPQLNWAEAEAMVRSVLPDAKVHRYMRFEGALHPVLPPERECPLSTLDRQPTAEEERAARADERCRIESAPSGLGLVVDDGGALTALTGVTDPERLAKAREVLARGGAVVNDERLIKDGRVILRDPVTEKTITVDGYYMGNHPGFWAMLSPAVDAGKKRVSGLVVDTSGVPAKAEEERLNLLMRRLDADIWIIVERGPAEPDPAGLIFAVVAALVALGAAGIATGLAAADSRADLGTLAAVGAAPRVRRRLSLSQAGVISGLGALTGAITGLGTAAVFILALNRFEQRLNPVPPPMPFVVPWDVVVVVLAVPLLAMAGAGLLTRSRLPIERRL